MLGKLIKHEFRATGRLMAPLFGALLLLAVFVRVSDLILSAADAPVFFEALNALLLVVYVLAILGVTVFATILMIKRFHQNFLTEDVYKRQRTISAFVTGRSIRYAVSRFSRSDCISMNRPRPL